jgi:hypothetical protein
MRLYLILPWIAVIATCCHDNQIYYNADNQTVATCNRQAIKSMSIERSDGQQYYTLAVKKGSKGKKEIDLESIASEYLLKFYFENIDIRDFQLSKNSTYIVANHSFGDAAVATIEIKTDSNGKIIYSSRINCD